VRAPRGSATGDSRERAAAERTGALPLPEALDSAFPGATALTLLDVYDWITPDGLRGGSAHMHLASTEGYVALAGRGRLQTLGARGLRPGDRGHQPLIAPTRPPTSLRWAKTKMASAGIIDSAVNA